MSVLGLLTVLWRASGVVCGLGGVDCGLGGVACGLIASQAGSYLVRASLSSANGPALGGAAGAA